VTTISLSLTNLMLRTIPGEITRYASQALQANCTRMAGELDGGHEFAAAMIAAILLLARRPADSMTGWCLPEQPTLVPPREGSGGEGEMP
jgi:hypothetical protein